MYFFETLLEISYVRSITHFNLFSKTYVLVERVSFFYSLAVIRIDFAHLLSENTHRSTNGLTHLDVCVSL